MKALPFVISKKAVSDLEEIWLYTGEKASKVKSHLIFYKIVNDTVEIIRILHERMDIENRLND